MFGPFFADVLMESELIKQYVIDKHVEPGFAGVLLALAGDELCVFEELIAQTDPSANNLREVFRLVEEVGQRDNLKRVAVFEKVRPQEIFQKKTSKKEKIKDIRVRLEELRFPFRAQVLAESEACRKSLSTLFSCELKLPEELEGNGIDISFKIQSPEDLKAWAVRFGEMAEHPELKKLYRILLGQDDE